MIISGTIRGIYAICFCLALLVNIIFIVISLKKEYGIEIILGFLFYENFGFIMGAKTLSYFANYPKYESILNSGMSAYGALIGGALMVCVFCFEFKLPINEFLYKYVILLPLIYAIGKLGCFFGGCCYGIKSDIPISVIYLNSIEASNNIKLFPVQLIECIANLMIFVWLVVCKKDNLTKMGWTFILCSFSKFTLDFFRASWSNSISVNQWISIFLFALGCGILLNSYRKSRR